MFGRVFDFLFPLECIACGASGAHACRACLASVPLAPQSWRLPELRASAAFAYGHPFVRRLLHDVKFERWTCARPALEALAGRWAVKVGKGFCPPETVVVSVPLHARKLRERGFNQAAFLADGIAATLGLRRGDAWLSRVVRTRPQTEAENRARNVVGAFHAQSSVSMRGRPVLLVDDVWTTGATMRECAKALRQAGAGQVFGFALAWGRGEKEKLRR
ncbi:MAG: phosphoribosyltransferase family protein [Patescibacteria group bacterium]|nr:MAG: phosphoribosyltransferase family protein [Patescibacteria group bacterium]